MWTQMLHNVIEFYFNFTLANTKQHTANIEIKLGKKIVRWHFVFFLSLLPSNSTIVVGSHCRNDVLSKLKRMLISISKTKGNVYVQLWWTHELCYNFHGEIGKRIKVKTKVDKNHSAMITMMMTNIQIRQHTHTRAIVFEKNSIYLVDLKKGRKNERQPKSAIEISMYSNIICFEYSIRTTETNQMEF